MSGPKRKCTICGEFTNTIFNINLTATHICDSCATSITIQQIKWWADNSQEIASFIRSDMEASKQKTKK